ncbi:MAG: aldo/keto reductase [Verrucomicrobia bacterium]|nr:aldo/keto reductase [Verrucomicrobiota bacterium]
MKKRNIGKSGIEASVVALGTWAIGGWMWGGTDEKEAVNAIDAAIEHGVDFIDTAPIYGSGRSEETLGKALKGKRDKVIIATKCGMVWHTEKGVHFFNTDEKWVNPETGQQKVYKYLGPESIRYEVEQSLRRLGTDYIDLYQTHWQDPTTPIADTMGELMKLKKEGKIRAIGVCNASTGDMEQYREHGQLDSDQERYNMLDRDAEETLLPYCRNNDVAFLAYSPLALGILSGKMGPDSKFDEGDHRSLVPRFKPEGIQKVNAMLGEFDQIADGHNAPISRLVIAWTLHQPGCSHVLVGARKPQHAIENALAADIELTDEELNTMNAVIDKYAPEIPPGSWR